MDSATKIGKRSALRPGVLCLVLGIVCSTPASAEELQLGVETQSVYNSNFFSSPINEDRAISLQVGPRIGVRDPDGRLQYDLSYTGAFQAYVDQNDVDAWESRLRGRVSYEIDRLTTVRMTERFRDISNLRFSRQDIALADTALDPNRDRYFRNELELEVIRDFSRYLEFRLRAEHQWIDFENNVDRNDSQAFEVGSELRYRMTPEHVFGVGASYTDQDFEPALSRLGSRGQYVNGYLSWTWNVSTDVFFSANGGPAWVRSNEDDTRSVKQNQFVGGRVDGDLFRAAFESCNDNEGGGDLASECDFASQDPISADSLGPLLEFDLSDGERVGTATELTFFGGATLRARFEPWNFQSFYTRRQSTTSGDGFASSLDRVTLEIELAPSSVRYSGFLAASFDRRRTLTEATVVDFVVVDGGNGEAERDTALLRIEDRRSTRDGYTAIAGVRASLARGQSGTLEFRYRTTDRRDSGTTRPRVETFFVLLSLDYDYEIIRF